MGTADPARELAALANATAVALLRLDANGACTWLNARWAEWTEQGAADAAGEGWHEAIAAVDRPALLAACRQTLGEGEPCAIEVRLARTGRWVLVQGSRPPGESGLVVTFTDVSAARSLREASLRSESLATLADTSQLIDADDGLLSLLQRVAQRAREVTGADYAAISTFDETGRLERFIYTGMDEAESRRLGQPPVGRGLLGDLATCDRPIRLEDLRSDPRHTGWPPGHPKMAAFLGIPIRAGGRTIGSFYMTRMEGHPPFSEADEFAATVLALQVALGLQVSLVHQRRNRVSLLEERGRIAHDLHDGTIQALYALGLEFDTFRNRTGLEPELSDLLGRGVSRINSLIGEIRRYIELLEADAPAGAPDLARDLPYILSQLVPPGVDTVLNISASALLDINEQESEDLLFITREALSNAVRHGKPGRVAVDLRQAPSETSLAVQDNGVGFDPEHTRPGLGTTTMRTRAERIGARLLVMSIPGMGTTVRVSLPRAAPGDPS